MMTNPAFQLVLGLCFMAGGGFVVAQGLRARKLNPAPWPRFFLAAFLIHIGILTVGLALTIRALRTLAGI